MEPGIVGELGKVREKKESLKTVSAVLCGDDDEVGAGPLPREQQIHIMVAGDLIHQRVLEHREAVAETDDDVAPKGFLSPLGRGRGDPWPDAPAEAPPACG